jgi:hypothetical protein
MTHNSQISDIYIYRYIYLRHLYIFLKYTQWILSCNNSTAVYKFLKTLHPGGIRTRDSLFCRRTPWPLCHAASAIGDIYNMDPREQTSGPNWEEKKSCPLASRLRKHSVCKNCKSGGQKADAADRAIALCFYAKNSAFRKNRKLYK